MPGPSLRGSLRRAIKRGSSRFPASRHQLAGRRRYRQRRSATLSRSPHSRHRGPAPTERPTYWSAFALQRRPTFGNSQRALSAILVLSSRRRWRCHGLGKIGRDARLEGRAYWHASESSAVMPTPSWIMQSRRCHDPSQGYNLQYVPHDRRRGSLGRPGAGSGRS